MTAVGIPFDFILFGLILLGVTVFHRHTLRVAVSGLVIVTVYELAIGDFSGTHGTAGLLQLLGNDWVTIANPLGLLLGFDVLADHFDKSGVPAILPHLSDGWMVGFVTLVLPPVVSSLLDNTAAAMVGGAMAAVMYQRRIHIGFLAAVFRPAMRAPPAAWWATTPP